MSAPCHHRSLGRIVIAIIVLWQFHIVAFACIAAVFLIQGIWRIFEMTCYEKLSSATSHHYAHTTFLRFGNDGELRIFLDIASVNFGMTAMRHSKYVVEATEYRQHWLESFLWEYAKHLLRQRIFRDVVEMV